MRNLRDSGAPRDGFDGRVLRFHTICTGMIHAPALTNYVMLPNVIFAGAPAKMLPFLREDAVV